MPSRRATRECSVERRWASCWSSQKPGSLIWPSSSASRRSSRSGSKVITDPAELGPDLLELILEAAFGLGHSPIVPARTGHLGAGREGRIVAGLWMLLHAFVTADTWCRRSCLG